MKKCTKCGLEKHESEFRIEKRTKIGLQSRCKKCESDYAKNPVQLEKRRIYSSVKNKTEDRKKYINEYLKNYLNNDDIKEKRKKYQKEYYLLNKEKVKLANNKWRQENKEKKKEINAKWNKNNQFLKNASLAKYRASKLKATPLWANFNEIKKIYKKAKEIGFHVDHIIPLQSKKVCGLHVHNNLQLLSKIENCSKGNKFYDQTT